MEDPYFWIQIQHALKNKLPYLKERSVFVHIHLWDKYEPKVWKFIVLHMIPGQNVWQKLNFSFAIQNILTKCLNILPWIFHWWLYNGGEDSEAEHIPGTWHLRFIPQIQQLNDLRLQMLKNIPLWDPEIPLPISLDNTELQKSL